MIYLRDRNAKKKTQGQDLTKRLILDELKYKITREINQHHNKEGEEKPKPKGENEEQKIQRPKYQIFKKDPENKNIEGLTSQRFVQSIVVDSKANIMVSGKESRKQKILTTEKCLDIQIVNMKGSRLKLENYLKLLEDENKDLKDKIQSLALKFDQSSLKLVQENSKKMREFKFTQLVQSQNISELNRKILNFEKAFQEGKNSLIKSSMQLIDAKNKMGVSLSIEKINEKHQKLNRCLEMNQKMISVYSDLLQGGNQQRNGDNNSCEELNSIIKYQQKTIQKLTQHKPKDGELYRENVLLRYETNRLSKYNEELLLLLSAGQKENEKNVFDSAPKKKQSDPIIQSNLNLSSNHSKDSTPIDKLSDPKSHEDFVKIEEGESDYEKQQQLWKSQLNEKQSRIKNLEIEKEFISDQLISLEKDFEDLQKDYRNINSEKEECQREINNLKQCTQQLKRELEVSEEQENVLNDQIHLLKQKIRHLEERGEQIKGVNVVASRYVAIPDDEIVTIQSLLKFFKKKELHKYHQALMDLISRYQLRISELNNGFKQQKELKDKLFSFARGLYSMVTSGRSLSLQNLVLEISRYEQIIQSVSQNEIDVALRQIKCFTIGVDSHEFQNILNQLKDYVIHLKSRLPVLSQEYFEDGSSVSENSTYLQHQDF